MDKVLIFGINGFTCRHFLRYIGAARLHDSFNFIGVGRRSSLLSFMPVRNADLTEKHAVESIISDERPDYIVNLAGSYDRADTEQFLQVNAEISRRICDSVLKEGLQIKKILLIGSAAEYGLPRRLPVAETDYARPVTYYGLSKHIQTQYALFYYHAFGMNVAVARPFNILGKGLPDSLAFGSFVRQIEASADGGEIFTGNLKAGRDFLDIDDVVDAYWKILLSGQSGEIYNVCSGESFTIQTLLDYVIKKTGKKLRISSKVSLVKEIDVEDICGDNTKLKDHTGWSPKATVWEALDKMVS